MRSSKGKTGVKVLLWLVAIATMLGTVVLVASWNKPSGYRRYVSPPLPDGTRYTLLYPAALEPTNRTARSVNFYKREQTFLASVVQIVPFLFGTRRAPERSEFLTVIHGPLKDRESSLPSSRQEIEGVGKHEAQREVRVVDARAKARFVLFHVIRSQANDRHEVRISPAVTHSFRILPPGVQTPSP